MNDFFFTKKCPKHPRHFEGGSAPRWPARQTRNPEVPNSSSALITGFFFLSSPELNSSTKLVNTQLVCLLTVQINKEINRKGLKIPTGRRQTSWLFTKRNKGVEIGVTEIKSSERQGGGFEPGTTRLQVQRPKPLGHAGFF